MSSASSYNDSQILHDIHDEVTHSIRSVAVSGGSSAATSFDHGGNSDVGTTAEQIVTTSTVAVKGVIVKAHRDNTGVIYIGNSDVTAATADATDGFPLESGEAITVEIDNVNKLYAIASAVNQKLYWLVV